MFSKSLGIVLFNILLILDVTHIHTCFASVAGDSSRQRGETLHDETVPLSSDAVDRRQFDEHSDEAAFGKVNPAVSDPHLSHPPVVDQHEHIPHLDRDPPGEVVHHVDPHVENTSQNHIDTAQEEAALNLSRTDEHIAPPPVPEVGKVAEEAVPVSEPAVVEVANVSANKSSHDENHSSNVVSSTLPPHRHTVPKDGDEDQHRHLEDEPPGALPADHHNLLSEEDDYDGAEDSSAESTFIEPGGRHHSVVRPSASSDEMKTPETVIHQQPPVVPPQPPVAEPVTTTTTTPAPTEAPPVITTPPSHVEPSPHRHQPVTLAPPTVPPPAVEQPVEVIPETVTTTTTEAPTTTTEAPTTTTTAVPLVVEEATTTLPPLPVETTALPLSEHSQHRHHPPVQQPASLSAGSNEHIEPPQQQQPPTEHIEQPPPVAASHIEPSSHERHHTPDVHAHPHRHSHEHHERHEDHHIPSPASLVEPEPENRQPPRAELPGLRKATPDMLGKFRQKHEAQITTTQAPPPAIHVEPDQHLHHNHDHHDHDHQHLHSDNHVHNDGESHHDLQGRGPEIIPDAQPVQEVETPQQQVNNNEATGQHHHHHSGENRSHYLLDDILEHYLDSLPLSAKAFLMSQPFGMSLSTTLLATLIPFVVFLWSSISMLLSSLFGPKRVAPKIDLEYVRNLEDKQFTLEKEYKALKEEFATSGGKGGADRQAEITALKAELGRYQAEVSRLTKHIQDGQSALTETTRMLQESQEELAIALKKAVAFEERSNEFAAVLVTKEEQLGTLKSQFEQYEISTGAQLSQLTEALSQNEALRQQIATRDEEIGQISSQYTQLEAYCAERVREYESLYKSFSELDFLQRTVTDEGGEDSREETLKKLTDASKIRAELEAALSEMNRYRDELEVANGTVSDLDGKLASMRDENVALKQSETNAQQAKREAETKLSVLSEYFTSRELELQKLIGEESVWRKQGENQSDSLQKTVLNLEAEVKAHKEQVEYLKNELAMVEQTHKTAIAREEKKALESWASARALERQLKEAQVESDALRQQLTNAVTGARGPGGAHPPFMPPPPGLIPPMPPHLLNVPPPPWGLRPPSERSSQGASSPRADNSILQNSSSDINTSMASLNQTSPQRVGVPPVPPGVRPGFLPPPGGLPGLPPPMMGGPPGRGGLPPLPPPGPHGFMGTPPIRAGAPFPPRPGMPPFPGQPPIRHMAPPNQYSGAESARSDEDDYTGSETGDSGSSTGSDDEELRELAANGGPPQPYPRPPFMPPNGQPGGFFPPPPGVPPGQFFPPPGMPPFGPPPGGMPPMPPRGVAPTPPFNYSNPSPANFRPQYPPGAGPPPPMPHQHHHQQQQHQQQMTANYHPPQPNPGLGP